MHETCDVLDRLPHGMPSAAYVTAMQVFWPAAPPQNRPVRPSHPGIMAPHGVPTALPAGWQVPGVAVAADAPVQAKPVPHGLLASQEDPISPQVSHELVATTQDWP